MKSYLKTITFLGLLVLSISCADRVDVYQSAEDTALQVLSITQTPGWAQDVWLTGNTAYIADGDQGITIWDVSDPSSPLMESTIRTLLSTERVKYSPMTKLTFIKNRNGKGGVTYYDSTGRRRDSIWEDGVGDFEIIDFAPDTVAMAAVDRNDFRRALRMVVLFNDEGSWVKNDITGTYISEVSSSSSRALLFDRDYVYIAHNQIGVTIIEVKYETDDIILTKIGNVDTPGAAREVCMSADKSHIIVADFQAGITIIDIMDKTNPTVVAELTPDGVDQMFYVTAVGDTVYALDNNNGMFAFDVSVPSEPRLIVRYDSPTPRGMHVDSDHTIYLADEDVGLVILKWRN